MKGNSRSYTTVSLYFSNSSKEDTAILDALQNKSKVGTSTSGLIKQILYSSLIEGVESKDIQNENAESIKSNSNKKNKEISAKDMLQMFDLEEN